MNFLKYPYIGLFVVFKEEKVVITDLDKTFEEFW